LTFIFLSSIAIFALSLKFSYSSWPPITGIDDWVKASYISAAILGGYIIIG
jgi:hypothetical protein